MVRQIHAAHCILCIHWSEAGVDVHMFSPRENTPRGPEDGAIAKNMLTCLHFRSHCICPEISLDPFFVCIKSVTPRIASLIVRVNDDIVLGVVLLKSRSR